MLPMTIWAGLECWSDEAPRDAEADAREDSLLDEQPPEDPNSCPACGDREGGCLVCAARPEGGERDG